MIAWWGGVWDQDTGKECIAKCRARTLVVENSVRSHIAGTFNGTVVIPDTKECYEAWCEFKLEGDVPAAAPTEQNGPAGEDRGEQCQIPVAMQQYCCQESEAEGGPPSSERPSTLPRLNSRMQ